ncbi:MAG TPA: hypothetical protein VFC51_09975 [Chloroflexota bacterium]|nr:hypothetical protein [Chloroflexota bacterium]
MSARPFEAPDPFVFRAIWGIPASGAEGFNLLVARQMLWLHRAAPAIRSLLFTERDQPICPSCGEVVEPGAPSVICVALLADRALQDQLRRDVAAFAIREPDALEAWWLMHGDCRDHLTRGEVRVWNQRLELALRACTRSN